MNKYLRAAVVVPFGACKMAVTKLAHFRGFHGPLLCMLSLNTEITPDPGSYLTIGRMFKMRDGAKVRVRRGAVCRIGDHAAIGSNSMVVCRERIEIGSNVQIAPGVQIYDHDHDFRHPDGLRANHFKTAPIVIGDDVWIGANAVILRGTEIGAGSVVAAGSVVKGKYPANSVIIQKRETNILER